MLKQLRVKFTVMMMTLVTLLLGSIFGLIYYFTASNLAQDSFEMMQAVAMRPTRPELPGAFPSEIRLPFFVVQISRTGALSAGGSELYDLSDEDALRELVLAAHETGKKDGTLTSYHLRFFSTETPDGEKIVFADTSSEQATLRGLVRTSLLIGIGSLIVLFFLSLWLARRAVRPVEQAWRQQKQFVADASHELKTPLTVIMTNAELLAAPAQEQAARLAAAGNILTVSHQMRTLVESLLNLARADQDAPRLAFCACDLSRLMLDACLPFEPVFFERGLSFSYDIAPGITVSGSESSLRQLAEILLDNAQKYTCPGGSARLCLQRRGKTHCRLCVRSQGPALSQEDCKNIFKRFYRLDAARSRDGSYGLGLSIAEAIARQHGGKIWAEGGEGENLFYVELPLEKQA